MVCSTLLSLLRTSWLVRFKDVWELGRSKRVSEICPQGSESINLKPPRKGFILITQRTLRQTKSSAMINEDSGLCANLGKVCPSCVAPRWNHKNTELCWMLPKAAGLRGSRDRGLQEDIPRIVILVLCALNS